MTAVPQGTFAARKVRANMTSGMERSIFNFQPMATLTDEKAGGQWKNANKDWTNNGPSFPKVNQQLVFAVLDHPPARYNSKLMNSIWGLYNRYSVHNLKKITGDVYFGQQQPESRKTSSPSAVAFNSSSPLPASCKAAIETPALAGGTRGLANAPNAWEKFLIGGYQH